MQLKMANGVANSKPPIAPAVYRPQPIPKVLQTKRSPGQNEQTKQAPRSPVAPPVYRPEAKKIVQPKAISQQRTPPILHPQKRVVQTKVSSSAKRHAAGAWKTSSVVQRSRTKVEDTRKFPGASVPDLSMLSYKDHVATRTVVFFQQVLSAALMVIKKKKTVTPNLFTDHARVQVQSGQRHKGVETVVGENNWDAAHLMNTSLVPELYANLTGQQLDSEDVQARWVASGATVNQFQKSNVSADKAIDLQQTNIKNEMLSALQSGKTLDQGFIEGYVQKYLAGLLANLQSKAPSSGVISGTAIKDDSYTAACEVIAAQQQQVGFIMGSILDELSGVERLFQ